MTFLILIVIMTALLMSVDDFYHHKVSLGTFELGVSFGLVILLTFFPWMFQH